MNLAQAVGSKFNELFSGKPLIVRSPGRANLIGEHTDYNMGYVLPCAIDKAIYFAIAPGAGRHCSFYALDLKQKFECETTELVKSERGWPNYLMGVVDQLQQSGRSVGGFNCVFGGNIPIGAGLSSSAAIEAGLMFALNYLYGLGLDKRSIVRLAQKSENEFVGVQCGIMDQFINIFGESGSALRIDCRSLDYKYFPFEDQNVSLVLFNSKVSHALASSEYNQRRRECGEGVKIIRKSAAAVETLRDVSSTMLGEFTTAMDPTIYRRCKYVVQENDRVLSACNALESKDLNAFGRYMFQTHDGLSRDYEVSCPELDYLVEAVRGKPGVYGARMMGGGFGGCTINLVEPNAVDSLGSMVTEKYFKKFHRKAEMYITSISSGTRIVPIDENSRD